MQKATTHKTSKWENKRDAFVIFLLLFPFIALLTPLTQISAEHQSAAYQILFYSKIVGLIIILFLYIKRYGICSFDKWILFLIAVWLISVFVNNTDYNAIVNEIGTILFYCCLFGYYIRKNTSIFLQVYSIMLGFMLFLNLVFLVIHPDGFYQSDSTWNPVRVNFLGLDNQISPLLFIFFILCYLCSKIQHNNRFIIVGGIIIAGNIALLNIGTLYTASLLFILCWIFHKKAPKLFQPKVILFIIAVLFCGIVLFRLQYLFDYYITQVLEKDITLTGRTYVWEEVFQMIPQKPLLGYGSSSLGHVVLGDRHAHNTILQMILQFGFIGFSVFCGLLFKSLKSSNTNIKNNTVYSFLILVFFAYNVALLTEVYPFVYYIIILLFLYYSNYIKTNKEKKIFNKYKSEILAEPQVI